MNKILKMSIAILFCMFFAQIALASDFTVTKDSRIGFKVKKLGMINVKGEFKQFSGNLSLNENNEITLLRGVVELESVFSNSKKRDKHLLENNFFDTNNYKQSYFEMTKYEYKDSKNGKLLGEVSGILNLHGEKKEIMFQSELEAGTKPKLTLRGELSIKDFGIKGSSVNSNKVKLEFATFWEAQQ